MGTRTPRVLNSRGLLLVVLACAASLFMAASASAQAGSPSTAPATAPMPSPTLGPSAGPTSAGFGVPSSPTAPPGAVNPDLVSDFGDIPLIIAGVGLFVGGYAIGALTWALYGGWEIPLIPFAHGVYEKPGAISLGSIAVTLEVVGIIMLVVGLARGGRHLDMRASNPLALTF